MEIALARLLLHHTRLLQQIVGNDAAHRIGLVVELDVHVLAEATGVVVAIRLRIAERLQYRIALNQHVLHPRKSSINIVFSIGNARRLIAIT